VSFFVHQASARKGCYERTRRWAVDTTLLRSCGRRLELKASRTLQEGQLRACQPRRQGRVHLARRPRGCDPRLGGTRAGSMPCSSCTSWIAQAARWTGPCSMRSLSGFGTVGPRWGAPSSACCSCSPSSSAPRALGDRRDRARYPHQPQRLLRRGTTDGSRGRTLKLYLRLRSPADHLGRSVLRGPVRAERGVAAFGLGGCQTGRNPAWEAGLSRRLLRRLEHGALERPSSGEAKRLPMVC
jgi:hypothetical protein